jgi:hypothetical protein
VDVAELNIAATQATLTTSALGGSSSSRTHTAADARAAESEPV